MTQRDGKVEGRDEDGEQGHKRSRNKGLYVDNGTKEGRRVLCTHGEPLGGQWFPRSARLVRWREGHGGAPGTPQPCRVCAGRTSSAGGRSSAARCVSQGSGTGQRESQRVKGSVRGGQRSCRPRGKVSGNTGERSLRGTVWVGRDHSCVIRNIRVPDPAEAAAHQSASLPGAELVLRPHPHPATGPYIVLGGLQRDPFILFYVNPQTREKHKIQLEETLKCHEIIFQYMHLGK